MKQISITSPAQLRRWRLDRRWAQTRAAMWYGCSARQWKNLEGGAHPIPRTLRLRINELHYQERLLTYARDEVLEILKADEVPPARRERLWALVNLLESGTPDPEALKMTPDRMQANQTRGVGAPQPSSEA